MQKILLLLLLIGFLFTPADAQDMPKDTGRKYHEEEFVFLTWNDAQPLAYIFQVATSYDGPRLVRFYRGWYGLNGDWSIFLDERLDNESPGKSPINDALHIKELANGNKVISFEYKKNKLELHVLDDITKFDIETGSAAREHTVRMRHATLLNKDTAISGVTIHTNQLFRTENPLLTSPRGLHGIYDEIYLITKEGDFLMASFSKTREERNLLLTRLNKVNKQSRDLKVEWDKTLRDEKVKLDYPIMWHIEQTAKTVQTDVYNLGSMILAGEPKTGAFDLYGMFMVKGTMITPKGGAPVLGIIKHIQD